MCVYEHTAHTHLLGKLFSKQSQLLWTLDWLAFSKPSHINYYVYIYIYTEYTVYIYIQTYDSYSGTDMLFLESPIYMYIYVPPPNFKLLELNIIWKRLKSLLFGIST